MRNTVSVEVRPQGASGYDVELRAAFRPPVVLAHFDISTAVETPKHVRVAMASVQARAYRDGFADATAKVLDSLGIA